MIKTRKQRPPILRGYDCSMCVYETTTTSIPDKFFTSPYFPNNRDNTITYTARSVVWCHLSKNKGKTLQQSTTSTPRTLTLQPINQSTNVKRYNAMHTTHGRLRTHSTRNGTISKTTYWSADRRSSETIDSTWLLP